MTSYSRVPTDLRQKTLLHLGVCKVQPQTHRHSNRTSRTFQFTTAIGEDGSNAVRELSAVTADSQMAFVPESSPVHAFTHRVRTSTRMSAFYFISCALVFFVTGLVSVYTNTRQYGRSCVGIDRGQFGIVAQLTIGKQQRRLQMLVRTDMVVDCEKQPSIVISNRDAVLHSQSAQCTSQSTCVDMITVRQGKHNALMLVSYHLGVQMLDGVTSAVLGFDGEIYMCLDSKYLFDEQQMCREGGSNEDETTFAVSTYHETLEFNLEVNSRGNYNFMSTVCDVSELTLIDLPNYCTDPLLVDDTCSSVKDKVTIMPGHTTSPATMTAMSTNDISNSEFSMDHLNYASAGSSCSAESGYGTFMALCLAASSTNSMYSCHVGGKTLPFMLFARKTLVFDFLDARANGNVSSVLISNNIALETQPLKDDLNLDNEWTTATWPAIRLLIMILAAAVVYIRQEDSMEQNDRLVVSCVRLILHQTSLSIQSASNTEKRVSRVIEIEDQSQILGFLAVLSRAVVVISLSNSWWKSGFVRVVLIQSVATSLSFIHWLLTHSHYADRIKRLALGGSSAIIDVSSAILLAYSTPPIRADLDKFNTIARLLTCALIVLTCPTRCFFSSACAGIIYGVESRLIAVFWAIQSISVANVIVDFFAVPAAIDMMRSYTGAWTAGAFCIFGTLLSICGPRLTANAIAIANASVKMKLVQEQSDSDSDNDNSTTKT
jgi:hypothetical protein